MRTTDFGSSGYAWDAPIRSVADLVPDDGVTQSSLTGSLTATEARSDAPRADLRSRQLDVASGVMSAVEALARAIDRGERQPALLALRRASGGLGAVRDAADDVQRLLDDGETLGASELQYVECVYWWFCELLRGLDAALSREDGAGALATAIIEAAGFAALYALAQLGPLHDSCAPRAEITRLHDEVQWLTWQLKDLAES